MQASEPDIETRSINEGNGTHKKTGLTPGFPRIRQRFVCQAANRNLVLRSRRFRPRRFPPPRLLPRPHFSLRGRSIDKQPLLVRLSFVSTELQEPEGVDLRTPRWTKSAQRKTSATSFLAAFSTSSNRFPWNYSRGTNARSRTTDGNRRTTRRWLRAGTKCGGQRNRSITCPRMSKANWGD